MKKTKMLCAVAAMCCTALAETAQLRILWGDVKKPSRTELRAVETRYADGSRTVCNYRSEPFAVDGSTIEPMGYVLFRR